MLNDYRINAISEIDNARAKFAIALNRGDVKAIKSLIRSGRIDIDEMGLLCSDVRMPLLSFCIQQRQPAVARALIEMGAAVNNIDSQGMSSLHYAVRENCYSVAKMLLEERADVHARDHSGMSPIHFAGQLSDPCKLDAKPTFQGMMKLLLSYGANSLTYSSIRWDALAYACATLNKAGVNTLIHCSKVNVNRIYPCGATPLSLVVTSGHSSLAKFNVMQLLLKNGADPNLRTGNQNTALHTVLITCEEFFRSGFNLFYCLCDYGADLSLLTFCGRHALLLSAERGFINVVRYTLTRSALPYDDTKLQRDALMNTISVLARKGCIEMLQLMFAANDERYLRQLLVDYKYIPQKRFLSYVIEFLNDKKEKARQVVSLKQMCRLTLRKHFRNDVSVLGLKGAVPKMLMDYLELRKL